MSWSIRIDIKKINDSNGLVVYIIKIVSYLSLGKNMKKIITLLLSSTILTVLSSCSPDTVKPIIFVKDETINIRQALNPYDLVLNYGDDQDTNPSLTIDSNNLNTSLPGQYQILFRVTDKAGNFSTAMSTVRVRTANQILENSFKFSGYTCRNGFCSTNTTLVYPSGTTRLLFLRFNINQSIFEFNVDRGRITEAEFDLVTGSFDYYHTDNYGTSPNVYTHSVRISYNAYTRNQTCTYSDTNPFGASFRETYCNSGKTDIDAIINRVNIHLDNSNLVYSDFK
jgi:hypothetical protein